MNGAPAPAPTYWAKFITGNADRIVKRGLSQQALDRLRETVGQHVMWGPEPLVEPEPERT